MIRHKPSEKMPEALLRVVIKLVNEPFVKAEAREWHFGHYNPSSDIWVVWRASRAARTEDCAGYFGTSKILWWADPMEEQEE